MVLNNDLKMINQIRPFFINMRQDMVKGTLCRDNQNQANDTSAKYHMVRAFPENLK